MVVSGIKSKPIYSPLRADAPGRYHVMLARGPGGVALLRVLGELEAESPARLDNTRVMYVPDAPGTLATPADLVARLRASGAANVRLFDDAPTLLAEFHSVLERSLMGTRVYVAGPESFLGLALRIAREFNLNKDEIRAEELGTQARRVHCVHCRTTAEDVRTNIVRCAGCARWLLVRDHYSRRLAAYMGVMVDAEAPGELPPLREMYP